MTKASPKIVFATTNKKKIQEVKTILTEWNILSLEDIGFKNEIPEPHDTFKQNAKEKSLAVSTFLQYSIPVFSEDSGLEVYSLNMDPGVKSARYAGDYSKDADNVKKLLINLNGVKKRQARFKTLICLIVNRQYYYFEGETQGKILLEQRGTNGFGYDSIFVPEFHTKSFAEMELEEKNQKSHRRIAVEKMQIFLHKKA